MAAEVVEVVAPAVEIVAAEGTSEATSQTEEEAPTIIILNQTKTKVILRLLIQSLTKKVPEALQMSRITRALSTGARPETRPTAVTP